MFNVGDRVIWNGKGASYPVNGTLTEQTVFGWIMEYGPSYLVAVYDSELTLLA